MKQKVIKLVKSIGYSANTSADVIFEESAKALLVVEKLESMGYRVELDVAGISTTGTAKATGMVVTIKRSSERLNISKLAFPMCNPSMLRRIKFRWLETTETVLHNGYRSGYGQSMNTIYDLSKVFKGCYILPGFIPDPQELIKEWKL